MENILDEIEENQDKELSDKEIFTKIWTSPRLVFRFINNYKYDKYVVGLLLLSGISRAFDRAGLKNIGDQMELWTIIVLCCVVGALMGWISIYIYAALISWTGGWLNGKGDTKSLLRVLAYALLPTIVALVFLIPQVAVYGIEKFRSDGNVTSADWLSNIVVYASMIFEFILSIWSIVMCVIAVSEVQKLSVLKSILNVFLPAFVILVPIILLILLFT